MNELTPLLTLFEQELGDHKIASQIKEWIKQLSFILKLIGGNLAFGSSPFWILWFGHFRCGQQITERKIHSHVENELLKGHCYSAVQEA